MTSFSELLTIISGIFKFWDDIKAFLAVRKQYSDEQWKAQGQALMESIKGATTDAERQALVDKLSSHDSSA